MDILTYNDENLRHQIENGKYNLGFYKVKFYSINGIPSSEITDEVSEYFFYPSGGSLRDKGFSIILYHSKYDIYRGFLPPHLKNTQAQ